METFIGFLELIAWIVGVLTLAATMTYVVVKLFPGRDEKAPQEGTETEGAGS